MKIVVRARADADLNAIFDWISKDNPRAAVEVIRRIRDRIKLLAVTGFTEMGRRGKVRGTRELVEGAYIIVYKVDRDRDEIVVVGISHAARRR